MHFLPRCKDIHDFFLSFLKAARKLSVNVTRRASSVYQFFQYKEELRTAKISLLVLVIAVLCWGPFFLNLALLVSLFGTKAIDRGHS